jgi:hypothetical protein
VEYYFNSYCVSGAGAEITPLIFWLKTTTGASPVDSNVDKTTTGFQNLCGVWPNQVEECLTGTEASALPSIYSQLDK